MTSETVDCMRYDPSEEIVLYDAEAARTAHRELFGLTDSCYFAIEGAITESILSFRPGVKRIQIAAGRETILKVAFWSETKPAPDDVLALLGKIDKFPGEPPVVPGSCVDSLCLSAGEGDSGFLRRICRKAKEMAESKLNRRKTAVECHLICDGTAKIIASSL